MKSNTQSASQNNTRALAFGTAEVCLQLFLLWKWIIKNVTRKDDHGWAVRGDTCRASISEYSDDTLQETPSFVKATRKDSDISQNTAGSMARVCQIPSQLQIDGASSVEICITLISHSVATIIEQILKSPSYCWKMVSHWIFLVFWLFLLNIKRFTSSSNRNETTVR